jgi:tRNA pseudouridine13 synthase
MDMAVRLRVTPEDFRVDEVPLYPAAREGEHTFVRIEKRLRTTEQVARDLARATGVSPRDVGYAGRKDRRAVATQWFSVPGLDPERALELGLPGARVLEAARHRHKLRTGQLRANRFDIAVDGVDDALYEAALERLQRVRALGFPNRFGAQRFGRDGRNAERALRLLQGERAAGSRRAARFLLSALQASVFNAALAARPSPPHVLECGDVAVRHDSGGLFVVEDPALEAARAAAWEISATGPIFGSRTVEPVGAVAARERAALVEHGVDPDALRLPRGVRLRGSRRALRARPEDALLARTGKRLRLRFALPTGSYATVFIGELLCTALEAGFE